MAHRTDPQDRRLDYIREQLPEIALIAEERVRTAVTEIWDRMWTQSEWDDIAEIPKNEAAPRATAHVAHAWTLVTHARTVARLAVANAEILTELHGIAYDHDALLAIGLLHDVSKIVEYEGDATQVGKGRFGHLVQHGVYGAFLMWQYELPAEWVHAVISHTPSSNNPPQTPEAVVVRYVDFLDTDAMLLDIGEPLHIA